MGLIQHCFFTALWMADIIPARGLKIRSLGRLSGCLLGGEFDTIKNRTCRHVDRYGSSSWCSDRLVGANTLVTIVLLFDLPRGVNVKS